MNCVDNNGTVGVGSCDVKHRRFARIAVELPQVAILGLAGLDDQPIAARVVNVGAQGVRVLVPAGIGEYWPRKGSPPQPMTLILDTMFGIRCLGYVAWSGPDAEHDDGMVYSGICLDPVDEEGKKVFQDFLKHLGV